MGKRFRSSGRTRFRFAMSRDTSGQSHRKCRQHSATVRNIWMNAIFYFHILLLLLLPYNGPDHTHTHPPTHTHACIKGDFRFIQVASFSFVGELWLGGGGGHGSREGIAINPQTLIFFVLPTTNCCGSAATAASPSPCAWTEAEAAQTVSLPWLVGACVIRQPSMRIEWNHKLIKRDLFAACKGFCHTVEQETRKQQRKCALPLMFYCYSLWQWVLVYFCVCLYACVLEN